MNKDSGGFKMDVYTFTVAAASVLFLAGCFGIGWLFGLGCKYGKEETHEVSDND